MAILAVNVIPPKIYEVPNEEKINEIIRKYAEIKHLIW